ncbi:MAG: Holliday junction resolvase RuvX [Deltaproteobacteria bacterium CG12_big_fil_rev_8_21_14_0_65_43_10]|nr:MAG: Holliday junction DNA helicase RuvA [Deltaproteobacteria bacterium CG2_30_43_15]PIQ44462.1 MAG: Holliday junction resolvase RuvX [Deltaproteobacteria bacterium CG12_big_fil_rev_8_21_14_0_65_43_10]PIU85719.1 MAG: Holliday junction resolvase RuvX [Deltaproteobacteria bacterium CG06_land_8_20_14_3_00_44_19]PIX22060.1 MAG: Holliday junction resolvase RuvX [Deltaproteobacteria bacterium CG_4_8_14_3_um_filter_43_13]PIZ19080.1 MAG: Holliday junction resolvase RuvX [Deltaproteobacteria bacteriu
MRIIGLDVGSKTIGVAVSDEMGWTAQGITTIIRKSLDSDLEELRKLMDQYNPLEIAVGLPKNMDGTIGKQAEGVLALVETMKKSLNIPVVTWDERLSTVAANRSLLEADLSRKKRKKVINKMAAVFILQGYLDSRAG